jgi:hypothetical protein
VVRCRWLCGFLLVGLLSAVALGASVAPAIAQESTPETFPEPTTEPTVERDIEDTDGQLKTAVIGLIAVAVVTLFLIIFYWRHTGRAARRRFEAVHGPLDDDEYYEYDDPGEYGFYEQPPGWR